eukprot:2227682-Rhodomonas_salina.1
MQHARSYNLRLRRSKKNIVEERAAIARYEKEMRYIARARVAGAAVRAERTAARSGRFDAVGPGAKRKTTALAWWKENRNEGG